VRLPSSLLPLIPPHPSVGGIYTVIRSKAGVTTAELGDQYCMIGPYNESCVRLEVEVGEPDLSVMKESIEAMQSEGVKVRTIKHVRGVKGLRLEPSSTYVERRG